VGHVIQGGIRDSDKAADINLARVAPVAVRGYRGRALARCQRRNAPPRRLDSEAEGSRTLDLGIAIGDKFFGEVT
jgi:hypothetical protein